MGRGASPAGFCLVNGLRSFIGALGTMVLGKNLSGIKKPPKRAVFRKTKNQLVALVRVVKPVP